MLQHKIFYNMTTDQRIERLFTLLTQWRAFPNYQLERRADIFFALYLDAILREKYPDNEFDLIVPEFPLRYGSIRDVVEGREANRSAKVDYLCLDRRNEFCLLLEFKTEERSLRVDQFENMNGAVTAGYKNLLLGVEELLKHSKEKGKYTTLLQHLNAEVLSTESGWAGSSSGAQKPTIKMAIIKPTADHSFCPEKCDVISFDEVIATLERIPGPIDSLTLTFIDALKKWKEPLSR